MLLIKTDLQANSRLLDFYLIQLSIFFGAFIIYNHKVITTKLKCLMGRLSELPQCNATNVHGIPTLGLVKPLVYTALCKVPLRLLIRAG